MILLAGRIAEEVFYGVSVTTGAINDFEEASKLAQKMILYYGMGSNVIMPYNSDKYKEEIDRDVMEIINTAYNSAKKILVGAKPLIEETSNILKSKKILKIKEIMDIIDDKYEYLHENDFSEYLDLC